MSRLSLDLSLTCDVGDGYAEYLDAKIRAAWANVDAAPRTLSVAVVDDATMGGLHERFLNLAGPTDVLTFELDHDADGRVTEGEVVICFGEATRQAAERGHAVGVELLLYALHGLLHLAGYDDLDDAAYERMHAKEDAVLTALGIGPVFRRDAGGDAGGDAAAVASGAARP